MACHMYRPLPDEVTIGPSKIEGLGLICKTHIKPGTVIGKIHFFVDGECMRTPLGAFGNHSDEPNCEKFWDHGSWYIRSIKDIWQGDEITWKYTLYKNFT